MLKLITSLLSLVVIAYNVNAVEVEAKDNSKFTKACVAAIESSDSLDSVLRINKIRSYSKEQVLCNDTPIAEFARTYKRSNNNNKNNNKKFQNANASNESKLCIAAATSNEAFSKAKRRFLAKVHPKQVVCNGMTLAQFAKQYNKSFNG